MSPSSINNIKMYLCKSYKQNSPVFLFIIPPFPGAFCVYNWSKFSFEVCQDLAVKAQIQLFCIYNYTQLCFNTNWSMYAAKEGH